MILSEEFLKKYRKSEKDFTRKRQLPFHLLILFLLNLIRSSLQNELDNFFKIIFNSAIPIHFITKSAFTKARKKLKYQAFIELLHIVNTFFYANFKIKTWNGFILKAVDGTSIAVPKNSETIKHFGVHKISNGDNTVVANVSQIYDCLNGITTSALISPEKKGERELLKMQINTLSKNDLLLLDRGYPAFWVFSILNEKNINYCARIETQKWNVVNKFYKSKAYDKIVDFYPSERARKYCFKHGISINPIKVRLVKIKLDSGQIEILVTTLTNQNKFKSNIFKDLYHNRWPVEEDYKVMKHKIEIENFSGKSIDAIHQDFYAKVFTKNLTAIIGTESQNIVDDKTKKRKRKYQYKINFTNALGKMKNTIVQLLFKKSNLKLLNQLIILISEESEAVRPNRKYPREHKMFSRRYYMQYKPIA